MQSWSAVACYRPCKSKYFRVTLWFSLELDQRLSAGVGGEALLSGPRDSDFV